MHTKLIMAAMLAISASTLTATGVIAQDRTPAPVDAQVYFIGLEDGATVSNPVTIAFGLTGMGIAPAGIDAADTGHHHLLINVDPATLDLNDGVPADDNHIHFGGGQTEVTRDLPLGTHTLALVLADHAHIPHDPPIISEMITITVE
ncbi:DUF4399 domain-containing protein [Yoonia sp.]|uniref:DUF4399 domain-containing protein n=1 Tax=Yoonia sp. TaxID=2212373 RepID=UPI003A4D1D27